jgi:outer membrane protein assembly factor BamA
MQVDQGIGVGSKFPFFNRHQLTLTRFFQLKEVEEGDGKPPPPVLVFHGHYGGCMGDLPSYDAFTLGGPYSVRGYNMGEIGAARNIVEVGISRYKYLISSPLCSHHGPMAFLMFE